MFHCFLFDGNILLAQGNGEWVGHNQIRFLNAIAAADGVNRITIGNDNFRVLDHAGVVFLVEPMVPEVEH